MELWRYISIAAFLIVALEQTEKVASLGRNGDDTVELNFMFITSKNRLFDSSGSRAAVDMALEKINGDGSLLSGYHLSRTADLDSNCSRITSLREFFGRLRDTQTRYIAVIGAGCSPATELIAEIVHYYNMAMLSYASSAEVLSNRYHFPSYFRTAPSEVVLTPGIANLVQSFGWRQIAFITEQQSLFLDTQLEVKVLLSAKGVDVETREFRSGRGPSSVEDIFVRERHMRVFVLNMYSLFASQVLCQAYLEHMCYPTYVWITYGWYNLDWWKRSKGTHNCSDEEMLLVLDRSLSVIQYPVTNATEVTYSGLTGDEFFQEYDSRLQQENLKHTVTAPLAYDSTWALALALNKSINTVNNMERMPLACMDISHTKLVPYENFTYSNDLLGCIIKENLNTTDFLGISGHVYFDLDGTRRDDSVRIEQYRTNETGSGVQRVVVAYLVNGMTQLSHTGEESSATIWPDGIPLDGIPRNVTTTVGLPLMVVMDILAFSGVGFAIVCLLFNILFRKRKVVRLTSPNLNYLIIMGAVFIYLSVVFLAMPFLELRLSTIYCNLNYWLFSCGNTLCFAVVLAKVWRVYYIFSDPTPNRMSPKDWQLLIIIALLVGVDSVILLVPTVLPASRLMATWTENKERPPAFNDVGILEVYYFYHCQNTSHVAWLSVSYTYKLLLQFIAIFLAFQTRKVKIRALNDSKEIAVIIYITSLILIALVGILFAVGSSYPKTFVVLAGIGRITYPTVILGFIFIPKMIFLYQDPNGEKIFSRNNSGSLPGGSNSSPKGSNGDKMTPKDNKVATLEKRVQELELELKDCQKRMDLLTEPNKSPPTSCSADDTVFKSCLNNSASMSEDKDSPGCTMSHKSLVNGTE